MVGLREMSLKDIVNFNNGKDWKDLESGDVPVYGSGGEMGVFVNKYTYNKPSVLIAKKGTIGNVFYLDKPFWNMSSIYYTEINEEYIMPKYLYYFMKNYNIKKISINSIIPSITEEILGRIKISLPPLIIQNKVVEKLEIFQSMVEETNDLKT